MTRTTTDRNYYVDWEFTSVKRIDLVQNTINLQNIINSVIYNELVFSSTCVRLSYKSRLERNRISACTCLDFAQLNRWVLISFISLTLEISFRYLEFSKNINISLMTFFSFYTIVYNFILVTPYLEIFNSQLNPVDQILYDFSIVYTSALFEELFMTVM